MITLLQGEELLESFDVKKSKKGKGTFHVSNYRIMFETPKHGMYLSVDWNHLRSVSAKKKILTKNSDTVLVVWDDDNPRRWRFDLKFSVPADHVIREIQNANAAWANGVDMATYEVAQSSKIPKKDEKRIRKERTKFFEEYLENAKKEHQEFMDSQDTSIPEVRKKIEERKKNLLVTAESNLRKIKTMSLLRDPRIPQNIPNEDCWKDCYYDKNWKGYVTFIVDEEGRHLFESELNDKFQKEINNGGLIISEEKILFNYGYPAILNSKGYPAPLATV